MDDETAEIELLEQNLNKTRQLSKRMISLLDSFDGRLAKLEKSILPLYTSTQVINKRASNIEKTLLKISEVSTSADGIAAEQTLILRGPQVGQLDRYKEALERLNVSILLKSSDIDTETTAQLVETGAKKLTQLYTKLVAEMSSGSTPVPGADWHMAPPPPSILSNLRQIVAFLKTLPLPATHPSHPAAPTIHATLKEAQKGYADMRGAWGQKCLEDQGKRVIDRADTIDVVEAGKEFGKWVELLLEVAEDEYQLLVQMVPLPSQTASCYSTLLAPLLKLFNNTLTSLVGLIKRSLHKYTFLALSAYEALLSLQPRWEGVLSRRATESRKDTNDFKEGLHTLRSVCLRSFPEFLADLKLGSMGKGGELVTTGLADFSISTVKYMERLPDVKSAVESALTTLGDGNWKMGEGVQVGSKNAKQDFGEDTAILEHFIYDLVLTATNSLNTLSRTSRRPAIAAIFLLNNISYLRHHLLLDPVHPSLPLLLSKPTKDQLDQSFRKAKAGYFDANFGPLTQALTDDPKEKANRSALKEKLTRFYDLLEEVMERHKFAKVMEEDADGREQIGDEIVKLVVPILQRFLQKHRDKEFSKNPQKYIKLSPEAVESQLRGVYR